MADTLLRLTDEEIQSLNVLMLASRAPDPNAPPPEPHPQYGVQPLYHHEIYQTLCSFGIRTTPCRDMAQFVRTAKDYNYICTLWNRAPLRNSEIFPSAVCEFNYIPYLGAPPNMRALAEDKYLTKWVARGLGIPTPQGRAYTSLDETDTPPDFSGPYFIKPRFGVNSEDISAEAAQPTWEGCRTVVRTLLERGKEALVEELIPGTDVTVPVLGGNPPILLPCAEIVSHEPYGIYTHRQKLYLDKNRDRQVFDDPVLTQTLCGHVRRFIAEVRPFDYLRVDFRIHGETRQAYLLEFNLGCDIGSHATLATMAAMAGIGHPDMINHIIAYSLRRQRMPDGVAPISQR